MFTFKPSTSDLPKTTPNLLPCRIAHTGPISASKRYWSPSVLELPHNEQSRISKKSTYRAYFRGRRLLSRRVALHPGYRGLIVRLTDETVDDPLKRHVSSDKVGPVEDEEDEDEAGEVEEPVKAMEPIAAFDAVTLWDHDAVPGEDDPAVRSLDEWIGLAEAMHSFDGAEKWRSGRQAEQTDSAQVASA